MWQRCRTQLYLACLQGFPRSSMSTGCMRASHRRPLGRRGCRGVEGSTGSSSEPVPGSVRTCTLSVLPVCRARDGPRLPCHCPPLLVVQPYGLHPARPLPCRLCRWPPAWRSSSVSSGLMSPPSPSGLLARLRPCFHSSLAVCPTAPGPSAPSNVLPFSSGPIHCRRPQCPVSPHSALPGGLSRSWSLTPRR